MVTRPLSSRKTSEILSAPKVYAFDTGFICHYRGWNVLRPADYGFLWKHLVLNEIQSRLPTRRIHYWRDKRGHEVDFILLKRSGQPIAVECKWASGEFEPKSFHGFAALYPEADGHVVAHDVSRPFTRRTGNLRIEFLGLSDLVRRLEAAGRSLRL